MKKVNLNNGISRSIITFILAFLALQLLRVLLRNTFAFEIYADQVIITIAAGWLAYWVYKKTEFGYY